MSRGFVAENYPTDSEAEPADDGEPADVKQPGDLGFPEPVYVDLDPPTPEQRKTIFKKLLPLFKQCLRGDPRKRPSAGELLTWWQNQNVTW
jgi:hypothetical protein